MNIIIQWYLFAMMNFAALVLTECAILIPKTEHFPDFGDFLAMLAIILSISSALLFIK